MTKPIKNTLPERDKKSKEFALFMIRDPEDHPTLSGLHSGTVKLICTNVSLDPKEPFKTQLFSTPFGPLLVSYWRATTHVKLDGCSLNLEESTLISRAILNSQSSTCWIPVPGKTYSAESSEGSTLKFKAKDTAGAGLPNCVRFISENFRFYGISTPEFSGEYEYEIFQ